jgi:hypothetical protein
MQEQEEDRQPTHVPECHVVLDIPMPELEAWPKGIKASFPAKAGTLSIFEYFLS